MHCILLRAMDHNRTRVSGDTYWRNAILPYFGLTKLSPIPRTNDMPGGRVLKKGKEEGVVEMMYLIT